MPTPKTLQQAILWFSDYEHCRQFMTDLRWPDGKVACPRCGSDRVKYLTKPRVWKCYAKHSKPTFSLKTGTVFEDSPIGFDKWLPAAWLVINCKNGISSYELARGLGITQKTAWFMLHRLRLALHDERRGKLNGEVEVDETYIGGKARNMHKKRRRELAIKAGRGESGKTVVMGILERRGQVRGVVVPDTKKRSLQPHIEANVEKGTTVYTDDFNAYMDLDEDFVHEVINHAEAYVNGQIHTNGLENFWSLLKRGLKGTYVSVEPFHLFRYLDEQMFRYNNRTLTDAQRFTIGVKSIVDRRLTYEQLTGKSQDSAVRPS